MGFSSFDERNCIYNIKGFSMLSVISAHVARTSVEGGNIVFEKTLSSLGSIGVVAFFILSGYLFSKKPWSPLDFFSKRLRSIILPWLICGSLVYLYIVIRKPDSLFASFSGYFGFLIGRGSYLYYLSMLMTCYVVAFLVYRNRMFTSAVIILSITSILFTTFNVFDRDIINPYMNPFNWFLYFFVGVCIQKRGTMSEVFLIAKKTRILSVSIIVIILFICGKNGSSIGYWSKVYIPFEFCALLVLLSFGCSQNIITTRFINRLGKQSFSVYLLHMPFAGVVAEIASHVGASFVVFLKPLITAIITLLSIWVYSVIVRRYFTNKVLLLTIGLRE